MKADLFPFLRIFALFYLFTTVVSFTYGSHVKYFIIVDAGSTGSRGFVYESVGDFSMVTKASAPDGNDFDANALRIYHVKTKGMKVTPGVSSFVDHIEDVKSYFAPIFLKAANIIPTEFHASTEVYILGTAGMRLLSRNASSMIWDHIVENLSKDQSFLFKISRQNVRTITGKEEAYFAAISTNYILRKIDANLVPIDNSLVGALDMGGSSTQLVLHTGTPPGKPVEESHFWSHSWLSYGVQKVRDRIWKYFIHQATSPQVQHSQNNVSSNHTPFPDIRIPISHKGNLSPVIPNGCLFRNYTELYFDQDENKHEMFTVRGTGNVSECKSALRQVLWPDGCRRSSVNSACSLDGIEHPPVTGNLFYGMSAYYFALDCMRHLGLKDLVHWPISNLRELNEAAHIFCEMDWHDVNGTFNHSVNVNRTKHKKTSSSGLPYRCFESLYLLLLLEEGFGFGLDERSVTLALKVEGVEVEWTLGYLLAKALPSSAWSENKNDRSEGGEESSTSSTVSHEVQKRIAALASTGLSRSTIDTMFGSDVVDSVLGPEKQTLEDNSSNRVENILVSRKVRYSIGSRLLSWKSMLASFSRNPSEVTSRFLALKSGNVKNIVHRCLSKFVAKIKASARFFAGRMGYYNRRISNAIERLVESAYTHK